MSQVQSDFSIALIQLKKGHKMARNGWNGKGMFVFKQDSGGVHLPFFCIQKGDETIQPGWVPSIGDLLATDWVQVS